MAKITLIMTGAIPNKGSTHVSKAERIYLVISILFIFVGVTGFVLLYFPFGIDAIPVVVSNLFTAFFVSGVALITFEKISHDHQKGLLGELQTNHKNIEGSMVDLAKFHLNEIEQASKKKTLRSLISGGDKIWERLEKEIIQKPFYAEERDLIYVLQKTENPDMIKLTTYEKALIRNNSSIGQNFPYHIFSEFNSVESQSGATVGFKYMWIDDTNYVKEVTETKSKDGKLKQEFFKELPIASESTSEMETKLEKNVIRHDFVRKQMIVSTEKVTVQILRDPQIRVDIWSANDDTLEEGIAKSNYIERKIEENAEEYNDLKQQHSTLHGLIKNESFIIEWYY